MPDQEITSLQNPKIKHLVKLRKHSVRAEEGLFLVEGYREVRRAMENHWPLRSLFYCRDLWLGSQEDLLLQSVREAGAPLYACPEEVFRKVAYRDRPDGLLAVAASVSRTLEDLKLSENPFLLVVVGIEKPGNLGTMLRTADGAGVDAVLVVDPVTDVFNPNTVRSSVGTLFSVPLVETSSDEVLPWLRARGIPIVSTSPDAPLPFYEQDLRGPVALVVGSEMLGLPERWLTETSVQVSLPMRGCADSLNVSIAASLVLYETLRQRMARRPA